jgi:DNA polymerase-1
MGCKYPKTEKGNACFNEGVLDQLTGPLGEIIKDYRHGYKKANTYYANYLYLADSRDDCIHENFRQGGTSFGRMSCSDPNLQNCNKVEESEEKYLVRRCFVPRDGFTFFMLDYQAQEYRLMADYAGEMDLIEQVIGGLDLHQATANMMGVTRKEAKTINFSLLYGSGIAKLAMSLFNPSVDEEVLKKIQKYAFEQRSVDRIGTLLSLDRATVIHNLEELDKAKAMKDLYFSKLPKVEQFISQVKAVAITRGFVCNWMGRKSHFPDPKWAYKAPNALIQGGSADIVKKAMVDIHEFLRNKKSRMVLQVHDEIIFEIPKEEYSIVPELKRIMEDAYPHKYLPMKVEVDYSETSWQDKKKFA